jgi:hypothetical protein
MAGKQSRRGQRILSARKTKQNSERSTQPPFLELGTLPEKIGDADLSTLNSALSFLFGRLREARAEFDQEGEGGRRGIVNALGAYWTFITLFRTPLAESLHVPILRLQEALAMLGQGRTEPMLKAVKRRGRAPSGPAYRGLKGHAAVTVQLLLQVGLARGDAHRAVATQLRQLGVKPERGSGTVTATTIRNWYDEVSKDFGRHDTAAMMYDYKLARGQEMLSVLPKDQAKRRALQELAGWVQLIFPKPRKPT